MFGKMMRDAVAATTAAPELIRQSNELAAQAQQFTAARQQAAEQAIAAQLGAPAAAGDTAFDLSPIGGLTLDTWATVAKRAAEQGVTDPAGFAAIAASFGVSGDVWQRGSEGWTARLQANPAVVGPAFHAAYSKA
jgi:hypothetical protein